MTRKIWLHDEDRSNPYLTNQVRRSGSPRPKNARARLEQEEKPEAIKASAHAAKQSNTPTRETKFDQVRASIAKYSGKKPSSSANKPITRSQTKNSTLFWTLYISRPCNGKGISPTSQKLVPSSRKCN